MELLVSRLNMRYLILLYGCFALLAYTMALGESSFPSGGERSIS